MKPLCRYNKINLNNLNENVVKIIDSTAAPSLIIDIKTSKSNYNIGSCFRGTVARSWSSHELYTFWSWGKGVFIIRDKNSWVRDLFYQGRYDSLNWWTEVNLRGVTVPSIDKMQTLEIELIILAVYIFDIIKSKKLYIYLSNNNGRLYSEMLLVRIRNHLLYYHIGFRADILCSFLCYVVADMGYLWEKFRLFWVSHPHQVRYKDELSSCGTRTYSI